MATYQVDILRRAQKQLAAVAKDARARLTAAILALAENPRPPGCSRLVGREGWRIRVGDYRALYQIDDTARRLIVVEIGHRREVYR